MKIYLTSFFLLLFTFSAFSQSALSGKVTDADTGEPILFGDVLVYQDSTLITKAQTDFDGAYNILPIDAGIYSVEFKYVGYTDMKIEGIVVEEDKETVLNSEIHSGVTLDEMIIVRRSCNYYPLIEENTTTQQTTSKETSLTSEQKALNIPNTKMTEIINNVKNPTKEEENN